MPETFGEKQRPFWPTRMTAPLPSLMRHGGRIHGTYDALVAPGDVLTET